jgi:hypothetical protein
MPAWGDMDFEERSRTLYQAARDDLLVKQIAHYTSTTSGTICAFARANGLPIRTRLPGLHKVVVRKRHAQLSPQSTPVHTHRNERGVAKPESLAARHKQAHPGT